MIRPEGSGLVAGGIVRPVGFGNVGRADRVAVRFRDIRFHRHVVLDAASKHREEEEEGKFLQGSSPCRNVRWAQQRPQLILSEGPPSPLGRLFPKRSIRTAPSQRKSRPQCRDFHQAILATCLSTSVERGPASRSPGPSRRLAPGQTEETEQTRAQQPRGCRYRNLGHRCERRDREDGGLVSADQSCGARFRVVIIISETTLR